MYLETKQEREICPECGAERHLVRAVEAGITIKKSWYSCGCCETTINTWGWLLIAVIGGFALGYTFNKITN